MLVSEKGREVAMFWYLEAIEMPPRPRSLFGAILNRKRPCMPALMGRPVAALAEPGRPCD